MTLALLLLASGGQVEIVRQSTIVPPADWKAQRFTMRKPGMVEVAFQMKTGGEGVRLALIARHEEARIQLRRPHSELASTGFARQGTLKARVTEPGEYSILVDNRLTPRLAATVEFRGTISYDPAAPKVRTLPRSRQAAVIGASLLCFFTICVLAGRRLWSVVAWRRNANPSGIE